MIERGSERRCPLKAQPLPETGRGLVTERAALRESGPRDGGAGGCYTGWATAWCISLRASFGSIGPRMRSSAMVWLHTPQPP